VSCDFGNFDIAGFPKPHAWWYAANWAQGFGAASPGRPPLPVQTVARLLDLPAPWNASSSVSASVAGAAAVAGAGKGPATISSITTAPFSELFLDGVSQGVQATPLNNMGEFDPTEWPVRTAAPAAAAGRAGLGPPAPITAPGAAACTGTASFPVDAGGRQCHGLTAHHAATAAACAKACCALGPGCDTWQLSSTKGCWVGASNELAGRCPKPKAGSSGTWVGGQRPAVPTPAPAPTPPPGSASYRNATLRGLAGGAAGAAVLATHTLFAATGHAAGYRLQLTLDVPSAGTGTGGALLLDGRDTALVRAAIVDGAAHDALVSTARDRVTWRVVSGAGRLHGISSGDSTSHEQMKSPSVAAFLGLARGLFRVTQDCTSTNRARAGAIDADAGRGPTAVHADAGACNAVPIVVEASAFGFAPVQLSIPVSVDAAKDGVMQVAKATAGAEGFADGFSYLRDFVG
jgi:hypothetical protein